MKHKRIYVYKEEMTKEEENENG
jgi:hypothetical protein